MKTSIRVNKKTKGRPKTTGPGKLVGIRFHDPELSKIDDWRRRHPDLPTRPEAVRLLVEIALTK
jgi:hypothetical protein